MSRFRLSVSIANRLQKFRKMTTACSEGSLLKLVGINHHLTRSPYNYTATNSNNTFGYRKGDVLEDPFNCWWLEDIYALTSLESQLSSPSTREIILHQYVEKVSDEWDMRLGFWQAETTCNSVGRDNSNTNNLHSRYGHEADFLHIGSQFCEPVQHGVQASSPDLQLRPFKLSTSITPSTPEELQNATESHYVHFRGTGIVYQNQVGEERKCVSLEDSGRQL